MVNLELGEEIEKHLFWSCHKRGKKKISSLHEEPNLRRSDPALRCSTRDTMISKAY